MNVIQIPYELELTRDPRRSGGIHQSSVIRSIALRSGFLDTKYAGEDIMDKLLVLIGLAFEDYVFRKYHPEVLYHPPEVELDGIKQSYDGIKDTTAGEYTKVWARKPPKDFGGVTLVEAKTTHKSARKILADPSLGFLDKRFWMWRSQMMGYCKSLETRWCTLHVLFMRGSWGKDWETKKPLYCIFEFEFSQFEIDENWDMLVNNRHLGVDEDQYLIDDVD